MMKKLTILFLFCCLNFFESFSQDFQWVRKFEGSYFSGDNASAIEVDSDENNYTFGIIFEPIFDIDPTSGTQIIDNTPQSTNQQCSLFLSKLDVNGNFIWGKTFGYLFDVNDRVIDIEIGSDGNIYLLADIHEQTSFLQKFITVLKIDPQGNVLLTKKITNIDNPSQYDVFYSSSLALDSQNNIFITGSYKNRLKIDAINPQLNFTTGGDSFLLKIDNLGNVVWGRRFNVLFTNDHYESVKVDNNDNPIVVVSNGDNQSYTNYGYNIFKINSANGNVAWQKFLDNQNPATFNIDNIGNIIIAGGGKNLFGSDIDVDPTSNNYYISPTKYILWLTNDGAFLDVKKYPPINPYNYFVFDKIEIDSSNRTYIVGQFNFAFDSDPSLNTYLLNYSCGFSSSIRDAFYIKFDENRNFENAFKLGDFNNNCLNFYFTDFKIRNDNQYYVGNFSNTADFDPTANSYTLSSSNPFGARFTLKLGPCNTSTPNGSNNQSFCSSQNPTIANLLPNSNSIKWYNSLTSTIQLPSSTVLVNGQTYYAANQNGSCPESSRLAVTVTINQTPNPPIINNQVFCESDNATISTLIASGLNIKWYASLTDTTELPSNHLLTSANYYATQTINNCESDRIGINVTVNSNSLPTATSPQTFCIQQNATVNDIIISGTNINWYNSSTAGNLLPNSTSLIDGTTYYASQTINGCESLRVPVTISIQNTPIPTGNASQEFCATSSPTLSDISVSGTAINWYANNAGTTILPNSTLLVNGTTYFATQTINGCESVGRLMINVSLINTLNANDYSQSFCDDLNDGSENVVLSDYNSNLIASTTGMNFTYYSSYYDAENEIITNQLNTNYNLSIGSTVVYVRLDSANGCHQIVELNLSLFQKPVIPIDDVMPICKTSTIVVNAGSGFNSYSWSTGASSQSIVISAAGTYSVTVTKNYGSLICSSTKTFNVVQSEIATITSIDTQDWTDTENVIIVSTAINDNYLYSLDGINYQVSNTFSGLPSGFYTVYVKDECGIIDEDVVLLNYPKFFTPNDDGTNDYWRIKFSQYEPNLTVTIFDRYGKIMKVLNPNSVGWDGTYNGTKMISDDYWFVVKREDGREHRAHFTLKR